MCALSVYGVLNQIGAEGSRIALPVDGIPTTDGLDTRVASMDLTHWQYGLFTEGSEALQG